MERKLLSLDEVVKLFPDSLRPTKKALEDAAEEYGCYRDVFGKKAFTDADVDELFEHMRGRPSVSASKLGPGRLMVHVPPKTERGYMVIIGDQLGEDETIFVAWAPNDGVGDMLRLVQFGNPGPLAILHYFPATPADVDAHRKTLRQWQEREDTTNWYRRSNFVNAYIQKLRAQTFDAAPETDEDTGEDDGTA